VALAVRIVDARAFAAVLARGAGGARVGTRFVATNESTVRGRVGRAVGAVAPGALNGSVQTNPGDTVRPAAAAVGEKV
jgi:NAD(P)H-dependent flavin oxidoreductase YrpB (nitropropane dioxygenase family)